MEELQIKNMVDFPTFLNTNGHKENTLDLILTSNPERLLELKSLPPLGNLCRAHVVLDLNFAVANFDGKKFNRENLSYPLANPACFKSISKEFQNLNFDECYESFVDIYENVCKKYIRKRRNNRGRKNKCFMNAEIRQV